VETVWRWWWGNFSTFVVLAVLAFLVGINLSCSERQDRSGDASKRAANPQLETPRVVALAPGLAQMVPPALLVGRHGFDRWSDQQLSVCGDQEGIDYETLRRVKPTHVLLQWGQRELPARLTTLAKQEGWIIENLPLLDLREIDASQARIDELLRAAGATNLPQREALDTQTVIQGLDATKTVLVVYQTGPITILGPGSYHHQLLVNLGATPAIAPSPKASAFMKLELEDVLAIDPWAIIAIQPRDEQLPTDRVEDPEKSWLGVLQTSKLSAVRASRVAMIDRSDALIPGPSLRHVREEMAAIMRRFLRSPPDGSTLPPS
jgi:hypothetical protein